MHKVNSSTAVGRQAEMVPSPSVTQNRLLSNLPEEQTAQLLVLSKRVEVAAGQIVYDGHSIGKYSYFIEDTLISMMSSAEQGGSVAVALVGNEGIMGAAALVDEHMLPYRSVALTSGGLLRIPVGAVREWLSHDVVLRRRILELVHSVFAQVVQTAACNRFHLTEQRLARWLLLARDRLAADILPFTHESLGQMVGTDRVSITRASQKLKAQGLVRYSRGKTTILDHQGLAAASCECYNVIKTGYDSLIRLCSEKVTPTVARATDSPPAP
jgi:CRP-like cAMP-binding protein